MTWNQSMTSATATSPIAKLTSSKSTFSKGKTIRSTLIFLSRGAASMIEDIAPVVALLIMPNRIVPKMR